MSNIKTIIILVIICIIIDILLFCYRLLYKPTQYFRLDKSFFEEQVENWSLSPLYYMNEFDDSLSNFNHSGSGINYSSFINTEGDICGKDSVGNILNFSGHCPINFIELSPKDNISDKYSFPIKTIYVKDGLYLHYSNQSKNGDIIVELQLIYKNSTKYNKELNEISISPKKCNYRLKEELNECQYNWKIVNPDYINSNNENLPILAYRTYLGYKDPKAKDVQLIVRYYNDKIFFFKYAILAFIIANFLLSIAYLIALKKEQIKGKGKFDNSNFFLGLSFIVILLKFGFSVNIARTPIDVYRIYYKNVYTGDEFKFSKTRYAFGIIFTIISLILIIFQFFNDIYKLIKKCHDDN